MRRFGHLLHSFRVSCYVLSTALENTCLFARRRPWQQLARRVCHNRLLILNAICGHLGRFLLLKQKARLPGSPPPATSSTKGRIYRTLPLSQQLQCRAAVLIWPVQPVQSWFCIFGALPVCRWVWVYRPNSANEALTRPPKIISCSFTRRPSLLQACCLQLMLGSPRLS